VSRSLAPWCAAIALALAVTGAAGAREGAEEEAAAQDPSYVAARLAITERRYAEAIRLLGEALARDPTSADIHNMLGYAHRKSGNLERAFQHYHEALRLNPDHRGAHEYIGEAYLLAGDLERAEDHLRRLIRLCPSPCEERDDLQQAIETYRKGRRSDTPAPASR
jgi:tetratricopeptide (TPR) repeat protein